MAAEEKQDQGGPAPEAAPSPEKASTDKASTDKASTDKASTGEASTGEEPTATGAADGGAPTASAKRDPAAASQRDEEDEGWPRSWIVVTAILGIIAIIVVARLMGQSWSSEEMQTPPPGAEPGAAQAERKGDPPAEPGAARGGEPAEPGAERSGPAGPQAEPGGGSPPALSIQNVEIPSGMRSCLATDGKAHEVKDGQPPPAVCNLPAAGANAFRLEVVRKESQNELPVWLQPSGKDVPVLYQLMMLPTPTDERPQWMAGGLQPTKELVLIVGGAGKEKITLRRVRLLTRAD